MLNHPLRLFCVLFVVALGLTACGGEEKEKEKGAAAKATPAEKAFLTAMAHHHETAVQMAELAEKRGKSSFVKKLSADIVKTQKAEIAEMRSIHQRLLGQALRPDPMAHDGLGLTAEEAGMTHTPATNTELARANPFDRAFVDEMVPHHEGAVRMAEAVLRDSRDASSRRLAQNIVTTQRREIDQMNAFRRRTYGAPVPEKKGHGGGRDAGPMQEGGVHGGH